MKKTNFFKLLMVGAIALTVGLAGCNKGPSEKDFKELCEKVDAMDLTVKDLQAKINGLEYVKSVTKTENANAIVYTVTHGNPTGTVEIIVPKDGPVSGDAWLTIGNNGNWYIDSKDTGEAAISTMPRIKTEGDQRYWEFPVIDPETDDIVWKRGETAPAYSYAVEGPSGWVLWMPTKDKPNELTSITITKSSGGLGKIDILGWVQNYDSAKDDISRNNEIDEPVGDHIGVADENSNHNTPLYFSQNQTFVVYYNYIDEFTGESNGASYSWTPSEDTELPFWANSYQVSPANQAPFDANGDGTIDSSYLWWNPAQITEGYGTAPAHDYRFGTLNVSKTAWNGGQYQVQAKSVLNILDSQNKGFIVQVHPITVPFSEYKNLTLQDSQDNVLPVGLKQPVLISGLLTRAASSSALYFVEGSNFPKGEFASRDKYAERFKPNAQYSLVTEDGIRSEYTPFTITPTYLASFEAQVIEVDGKELHAPRPNPHVLASFYVEKDKWNNLTFDQDYIVHPEDATPRAFITHAEEITPMWDGDDVKIGTVNTANTGVDEAGSYFHPLDPVGNGFLQYDSGTALTRREYLTTNAVVDWYMKVGSNDDDETYVTNVFGIQFNATKTEFKATKIPDGLTEAMFNMRVFKLGVDGRIYLQFIKINVTRQSIVTPIPITPYLVQDEFPQMAEPGTPASTDPYNFYDVISSPLSIDLAPMFTALSAITDVEEENLANRWMDDDWGAKTYKIASIKNVTKDEEQLDRFDPYLGTNAVDGSYVYPDGTTYNPGWAATPVHDKTASTPTRLFAIDQQPSAGKSVIKWISRDANATIKAPEKDHVGTMIGAVTLPTISQSTLYDARKLEIFPNYAYSDGANGDVRTFDLGDDYVITIEFYDKGDRKLNAIEIKFTPQRPTLDRLFKKQPRRWNTDESVLMAYYDLPGIFPDDAWRETKFYGTDVKAADDWKIMPAPVSPLTWQNSVIGRVALNWYNATYYGGANGPAAETVSRNSTYYNVFNPGGVTDLTHTSWRPLDGGYLKVGQRGDEENPKQWLAYTQVELKDPDGEFEGGVYSDYIDAPGRDAAYPRLPGTAYTTQGNGAQNRNFTSGTIVQLYNQTNTNGNLTSFENNGTTPETADYTGIPFSDEGNAYGDEIPMRWELGPYIGFYYYTDPEMDVNDFKISVRSALADGRIASTGEAAENMGGNYTRINDDHIKMFDYAGNARSLFKESVPNGSGNVKTGYAYTYIAKVLFYRPAEVDDYDIIDANDSANNNGVEARLATGSGASLVKAHVPILTKNIVKAFTTKIHVKVYDRFGRTLEQDVDISIKDELND